MANIGSFAGTKKDIQRVWVYGLTIIQPKNEFGIGFDLIIS